MTSGAQGFGGGRPSIAPGMAEGGMQGAGPSGLLQLDALCSDPAHHGVLSVWVRSEELAGVAAHARRRLRQAGREVRVFFGDGVDDVWRGIVSHLEPRLEREQSSDPYAVAERLAPRMRGGAWLVVAESFSTWGSAVAHEIARLLAAEPAQSETKTKDARTGDARTSAIFITARPWNQAGALEVKEPLGDVELAVWWEAVAGEAHRPDGVEGIGELESWWCRSVAGDPSQAWARCSTAALRLAGMLLLSKRPWPRAEIDHLGPVPALEELVSRGLAAADDKARVSILRDARAPAIELEPAERLAVAHGLEMIAPDDPWASVRACEIFAAAGDWGLSESSMTRALMRVTDGAAREDFWARWGAVLEQLESAARLPKVLRAAELGLRLGDVERSLDFAQKAVAAAEVGAASASERFDTQLALGRAMAARGDLSSATVALRRALELAQTPHHQSRASVEMAEVRYIVGDFDAAEELAHRALEEAPDGATRLMARNVLGKLLLARSSWTDAEMHFAADACDAACIGDTVAELRARLNRGIALMSAGRLDEARALLVGVLDDGERYRELRAVSLALANLAAVAIMQHDYVEALRFSERAINIRRRIGARLGLARFITNLAELRLRLGMVDEAEQALVFGRNVCGREMPGARLADFALVAARVHLARGNTLDATAELNAALAGAEGSSDGAMVGECHRLEARIALEDGDIARADAAVARAGQGSRASARATAELAILRALVLRAKGESFVEQAREALEGATQADDDELRREAAMVLSQPGLTDAAAHLRAALKLRDRIADSLPQNLRESFLRRRDLAELAAREREVEEVEPEPDSEPPKPRPSAHRGPARGPSLVGESPSMQSLRTMIRKIAPSEATVLIHGESGTGKELVADALHRQSPRARGPLVKVNCAALVETLLLSELFGHERGAFTGAVSRRRGRFELAEGGTIFLDEIGDISHRTQVALLRVLQDRSFERVGGVSPLSANVRIVCATHRDLKALVADGAFREDLYYRLRGVVLEVPPLRDRLEDVELLSAALLDRIASERGTTVKRLSPAAVSALARHAWPGNVRELENALRAASLFAEGETVDVEDFINNVDGLKVLMEAPPTLPQGHFGASRGTVMSPPSSPYGASPTNTVSHGMLPAAAGGSGGESTRAQPFGPSMNEPPASVPPSPPSGGGPGLGQPMPPTEAAYHHIRAGTSLADLKKEIERECIRRALAESQGNITKAAGLLGMKRPRLSQLVKQYGLSTSGD